MSFNVTTTIGRLRVLIITISIIISTLRKIWSTDTNFWVSLISVGGKTLTMILAITFKALRAYIYETLRTPIIRQFATRINECIKIPTNLGT